jgi:hypothetical protein
LPPYPILDEVLKLLIEGRRLAEWEYENAFAFVAQLRLKPEGLAMIERVKGMIARNEYKRRQAPPIIRLRALFWFRSSDADSRKVPVRRYDINL